MELRQRHDNHTGWDNTEAALRPTTSSVCRTVPVARENRCLFAGLMQHPVLNKTLHQQLQPLTRHSAAIYSRLFPESPCPEETSSLTLYERLTIALTVAQLTETVFLSDFYAEWLSPLPGPSGSRENNLRLTAITEYTRLLTCSSAGTPSPGLSGLQQAGVSYPDILVLHQLCGFVGWQSQWISGVMTLAADGVKTRYSTPPIPPYPDLLSPCSASEPLPAINAGTPLTARRSLLRDIRALAHPLLNANNIGQAPTAARAWLILRELSVPHPAATDTVAGPDLHRRTSPLSCQELEALKRQAGKTDGLLMLLGIIGMNIWDYRLIQLAGV